jgi:farnesyl diphosphate synthase
MGWIGIRGRPMRRGAEATSSFGERLAACAAAIEAILDRVLSGDATDGEICRPARLVAAMRHAMLGGGKRLRPFLTFETARLLGGDEGGALRAGAAIELVHGYSLVHDDLPAMDDDDVRRGRPSVHRAFDEATAILAGDALLTLAFETMTKAATHADPSVRLRLVARLARAAGLGGMVGGQMLDLAAEGRYGAARLSEADIRRMQAMKTGALIGFAVEAGAIIGGAAEAVLDSLAAYGRALGAAFQIADDMLDREASGETLGKRAGKDAARGKATLVDALGLPAARAERDRLAQAAVAALDRFDARADVLRQAARFAAERQS